MPGPCAQPLNPWCPRSSHILICQYNNLHFVYCREARGESMATDRPVPMLMTCVIVLPVLDHGTEIFTWAPSKSYGLYVQTIACSKECYLNT